MSGNKQITSDTLVDQSYWDSSYSDVAPHMVPESDQLRIWLEKYVAAGNGRNCLEVGCYPARYLSVLGELGYTLNGIDLTPRVSELKMSLSQKYPTGEFIHADFLSYDNNSAFDLVCSFGFIEHFTNWQEVLIKHAQLVKNNGLLVIETPNFGGWFQRLIHSWLDNENYKRHNVESMDPKQWAELIEPLGFEIIRCEYFGRFEFWSDTKRYTLLQHIGLRLLGKCDPILKKIRPGKRAFSPYCGLIAIRKNG